MSKEKKVEYKDFSEEYYYTNDFDENSWLNKLGAKGWVLIGETHTTVYSSGDRIINGKFRRAR